MRHVDATPLRLALFTDTYAPQVNGVARTLERLVDAVAARGGCTRVFTSEDPAADAAPHVKRFPSRAFWAYNQLRLSWPTHARVCNELDAFRPTLVHAATEFGMGLAGRRAALARGIPFVSSYHTSFTSYARFYRLGALATPGWKFLRWFHNSGLRTYCPTQAIIDEVRAEGFSNTAIWSRGVDTTRFSPRFRSEILRARLQATDDTVVIAYVGRLAAEKGLDVGMQAVRQAHAACGTRVRFMAVGDGPYADAAREMAPAGSWLPGTLRGADLSEAYASADVFLFPSVTDTFGNVVLEAMASGLPVIGADVGPTREQVAPDRGWLVPPGDASAFACAITQAVEDVDARQRARAAALAHAERQTWDAVWDGLIGDYLQLHRHEDGITRSRSA